MSRDNRSANRRAAQVVGANAVKEVAATPITPAVATPVLSPERAAQLDFFKKTSGEDMIDTEAEDYENSEVEETVPATAAVSAPSVESTDDESEEEVASEGEAEGDEEQVAEEEGQEAAAETPSKEVKEPEAKADAEKVTEPAPKEAKKEEVKTEPVVEEAKPLSNEEAAKLYSDWRGETETLLATHHYNLDEKAVEELNANPAAYIPKAMARVYMDSISAAFQQFSNYLPRMLDQVIQQRNATNASEQAFFNAWPDLADKRDVVLRLGRAYRNSNPSATQEDFIKEVGAQAMVALRLTPNGTKPNAVSKQESFKPAVNTPAPVPPVPKINNPFESLLEEYSISEEEIDES